MMTKDKTILEGIKYTGYNYPEVNDWITGVAHVYPTWWHNCGTVEFTMEFSTPNGTLTAFVGDYIIKKADGSFDVCASREANNT